MTNLLSREGFMAITQHNCPAGIGQDGQESLDKHDAALRDELQDCRSQGLFLETQISELRGQMEVILQHTAALEGENARYRKSITGPFRVGRSIGTTIYRGDEPQPCAWVPNDPDLASKIVSGLNQVSTCA